jgi:site-specific recombinase XerD
MAACSTIHFAKELAITSLRQRMIEDMQIRNLAVDTQNTYVLQVSMFARHFGKSPEMLGPEQIRTYQVYLTNEKKLATSSILIAICALRFLYKVTLKKNWALEEVIPAPKKPQKLPIVLSPDEVMQFLRAVGSTKHRVILTTCYAAGLRISEAIRLRPPAIDSKRMVLRVEQGKGQKDRYALGRCGEAKLHGRSNRPALAETTCSRRLLRRDDTRHSSLYFHSSTCPPHRPSIFLAQAVLEIPSAALDISQSHPLAGHCGD